MMMTDITLVQREQVSSRRFTERTDVGKIQFRWQPCAESCEFFFFFLTRVSIERVLIGRYNAKCKFSNKILVYTLQKQ